MNPMQQFIDLWNRDREQMARYDRRKPEPSNVVDLQAERSKRWLIKHTRPMPPDPPGAA